MPVLSFTSFPLEFPVKSYSNSNSGCLLLLDVSFPPCIWPSPSFPFPHCPSAVASCLKKGSVHTGDCGAVVPFALCTITRDVCCSLGSVLHPQLSKQCIFPTNITSFVVRGTTLSYGERCPDQLGVYATALASIHDSPSLKGSVKPDEVFLIYKEGL